MSWRIDNHPAGDLQIEHLAAPRFTARWTTGEFPIEEVNHGSFFWTDEGSGAEDAIHLFGFAWIEPAPSAREMERLMRAASLMIEAHVLSGE
ncbi:MAG: hypothetical protein V2I43_21100 [Parvularcula sp.]|jgi:hypothetical protein|nr:hypothetical protein [Parvularcula sp.]